MRRTAFALAAVLPLLTGCPADTCEEPVYAGDATDEAWLSLQDGESRVQVGAAQAATLTLPAEGAQVTAPVTFEWSSPLVSVQPPAGERRWAQALPAARRSAWSRARDWILPPAHAHLPPVTGDIHVLSFQVPGRSCDFRVVTTALSWTANDAALEAFRAAEGQPISLELTSAYLTQNRITEGPFRPSAPATFSLAP